MIFLQEGSLFAPQAIVLDFEKRFHPKEMDLIKCFRENLPSSAMTNRALGTVIETYPKDSLKKTLIRLQHFVLNLLVPLGFYLFDVVTDILLTLQYQSEQCLLDKNQTVHETHVKNITGIPSDLYQMECNQKFSFSLLFIILPWIFYLLELIFSGKFLTIKNNIRMNNQKSEYFSNIMEFSKLFLYFWFWPLIIFVERFWTGLQTALKKVLFAVSHLKFTNNILNRELIRKTTTTNVR